jgi:uncharacterized membrane protein
MDLRLVPGLRVAFRRPRLFFSIAIGLATWFVIPDPMVPQAITRALLAWNAGATLYLVLAMIMMAQSSFDKMRARAKAQDEGAFVLLVVITISSLATLCAIALELSAAKDLSGWPKSGHIAVSVMTVFTTWAVIQTMFALHYAHEYHMVRAGKAHGLDFPGSQVPDYFDFLYASCIIGTSGQTADVSFNTRAMRRIGLMHSVLSFFFNTILLALTINIAAGLL